MTVPDGRAARHKRIAEKNIERVKAWRKKKPHGFRGDCATDLQLSYRTVCKIIKGIEKGGKDEQQ